MSWHMFGDFRAHRSMWIRPDVRDVSPLASVGVAYNMLTGLAIAARPYGGSVYLDILVLAFTEVV